jgi:hypothetical protein
MEKEWIKFHGEWNYDIHPQSAFPRPKKALGVGHGSAQDAGGVFESRVVWKHGL